MHPLPSPGGYKVGLKPSNAGERSNDPTSYAGPVERLKFNEWKSLELSSIMGINYYKVVLFRFSNFIGIKLWTCLGNPRSKYAFLNLKVIEPDELNLGIYCHVWFAEGTDYFGLLCRAWTYIYIITYILLAHACARWETGWTGATLPWRGGRLGRSLQAESLLCLWNSWNQGSNWSNLGISMNLGPGFTATSEISWLHDRYMPAWTVPRWEKSRQDAVGLESRGFTLHKNMGFST